MKRGRSTRPSGAKKYVSAAAYEEFRKLAGMPALRQPVRRNVRTAGYLGMELKFVDQTVSARTIPATVSSAEMDPTTNNCLNAVDQGDGESQRDGRKYIMKSVNVKGYVDLPTAASLNNETTVFVALVWDKQTNGTQLNSEDVFAIPSSGAPSKPFVNLQFRNRFQILGSTSCDLVPMSGGDTNSASARKSFEFYKKINVAVICNGTGGTVSSITDNSLHIVAFSQQGVSPTLTYNSRIRFMG